MNMAAPQTVTDAPAPWSLQGRGYICMLRAPQALLDDGSFVPATLHGRRKRSPYGYLMFVDYAQSPVGPYHELLFIPGSFTFADGQRHFSISRIFVSSLDSVVNGQRNWGIPKDVAQFNVRYGDNGLDRVRVSRNGQVFAELDFASWPIPLPFSTALLPKAWTTLGQHHQSQTFIYRPTARGWVRPGSLRRCRFDAAVFPDLAQARPLLTVEVTSFDMTFHEAAVRPLPA
ncbi:MAG: hypothetical protein E6R07_08340 [Nevskiaceae bacterium]|nr:MAG: hypothetical protein E6R07_08340 [Nevskiaceae bacterium]